MAESYQPVASTSSYDPATRAPAFPCEDLKTFTAVEFPGKVGSSATSVNAAINSLGGLPRLNEALATEDENLSVVEMRLAPPSKPGAVTYEHPVPADNVATGNMVLKVTRRKRKKQAPDGEPQQKGIYTVETAGVVKRTLRFRSMADFQYHPPIQAEPDNAKELAEALKRMDVEKFYDWKVPPTSEDFSKLRLIPPPMFARLGTPVTYNYKPLPGTVPTTVTNGRGDEVTRLISAHRYKGIVFSTASFYDDKPVPEGPVQGARLPKTQDEQQLVEKVKHLMDQRPMWTRMALMNHLNTADARKLYNSPLKALLGSASYSFDDGPFRELVIRYGFDPRTDPEARKYQRIMLRNMGNKKRYPTLDYENNEETRQRTHIFDGQQVYREVANYQLCDISDPMLREVVDNPLYWLSEPDERTGWYLPTLFDNFRELLRCKFISLVNGEPVPEEQLQEAVARLPTAAQVKAEKQRIAADSRSRAKGAGAANGQSRDTTSRATSLEANEEVQRASTVPQAATLGHDDEGDGVSTEDDVPAGEGDAVAPARRRVLPSTSSKPKPKKRTAGAK